MFIKNITEPLQHMIEVSKLIAAGDLSRTVSIRAKNELAEMGATVNELTSNLQEMLLLSKDMCAAICRFTAEISGIMDSEKVDREKAGDLQHKMHLLDAKTRFMNDIIVNCKFYGMGK
jgi:methyl-accepting chemotaxis protein